MGDTSFQGAQQELHWSQMLQIPGAVSESKVWWMEPGVCSVKTKSVLPISPLGSSLEASAFHL